MARRINAKLVLELIGREMSGREIYRSRRIAQQSVKKVREAAQRKGVSWEDVSTMSEKEVYDLWMGMGWRTRHRDEYVVVLQREPLHAAKTWSDHAIPDVWEEKVGKRHPHSKPIGLQERLIRAVTQPGELVVDPAAGGYSVLEACVRCDRNFCGCNIEFGEEVGDE